ncbi:MAG: hypothetical protein IIU55_01350 [Paludibacteraceae bacterium]|nr:hypothetical protein [Paludibacteraceae bacterium]
MNKIGRIIMCFWLCVAMAAHGQYIGVENVLEDIFNQLSEDSDCPYEDIEEELLNIAENPMDLNEVKQEDLSRLIFLSDEQIDAILMYQYEHGFKEIYELQLIDCLKDYEIRNLLPFVKVDAKSDRLEAKGKDIYFREVFHYAKHEMTLRVDARNIEDFDGDPIYSKLRYRFNYQNRVQAGVTAMMAIGDGQLALSERWDYGGYVQLKDIGPIKTIVAGNYQANFGYGLVVGSPFKRGKSAYIQSTATTDEGLKKFSSVGDSYNYFHGVGATARIKWADVSAFYSLREDQKTEAWQHVMGVNITARWKKLKVGVTGIEAMRRETKGDEAIRQENKGAIGANVRYNWGKVDVWGEVAASHTEQWSWGTIMGLRVNPISDLNLVAIYRYYSPEYDNIYANALSSKTRVYDEHGGYFGVEFNRLKNWQLSVFCDIWKEGYETIAQADFVPKKDYKMHMRLRAKKKNEINTYSARWNTIWDLGSWKLKTQADGNMVYTKEKWSYGWSLFQDIEYHFADVPIVLQLRAQAFNAKEWNNRVYIYENDVLYAYAIPFVYGIGGRFWLNARYKINDTFSVYLRVSETVYQNAWAIEHDKKSTRTDVHALLRVKL